MQVRLFVVDTENISDYSFLDELTSKDKVILFVTEKTKNIKPIDLISLFSTKSKIKIEHAVNTPHKNSLDFQITVYVTEETIKNKYTSIVIVSQDQGYKGAVEYINKRLKGNISLLGFNDNGNVAENGYSENSEIKKITEIAAKSTSKQEFHNKLTQMFGSNGAEFYQKYKGLVK